MKYKFTALLRGFRLGKLVGHRDSWQRCLQSWIGLATVGVVFVAVLNCPTLVCAQSASGATPAGQNLAAGKLDGQLLMRKASETTSQHNTIQARLRVRTDLLGQPLIGSGSYAQLRSNVAGARGPHLRLELAIQAGEQATSVKQISDSQVMWESWRIGGSVKLNRIDLNRVDAAIRNASGNPVSTSTSASLATGGLPKLLKQLDENFDFSQTPVRRGTISKVPVFLLSGVWQAEKLAALTPESVEDNTIYFEKLPLHLPHQVEILIGIEDSFPYRVTYQRWQPQDGEHKLHPVVITEFFEVAIDDHIDQSQFEFHKPKEIKVTDRTDVFLQSMGLTPIRR